MGLKYKRNTDGWTPSKDDDFNNDDPWTAEIQVPKQSKKKKEGQTDGKVKTQTLEFQRPQKGQISTSVNQVLKDHF